MQWHASELARALSQRSLTEGEVRVEGPDVLIDGVSFDTRDLRAGQMFVPLVAQRDGHDFIDEALRRGAVAYFTSRPGETSRHGGTAIVVNDTAAALSDAASWARGLFPASTVVVGVTGSVGKTTTKEFIVSALQGSQRVAANIRSYNNEQGLPVTILNAPLDTQVLVLEMGMRGFGQIADLCRVARPSIGVVTRVGHAHTELVGGLDGVATAKGELIEALPPQGMAILNADDPRVLAMRSRSSAPVLTFGQATSSDIRIEDLRLDEFGRARFVIVSPSGRSEASLAVPGRHMALNAAAAVAVGEAVGVPLADMVERLALGRSMDHRMEMRRTSTGTLLIDDCYNANPTSMQAALETLKEIPGTRHVALVGVMAELEDPQLSHREIREFAVQHGIELIAVDTDLYGIDGVEIERAIDLALGLTHEDVLLVKGSRVAALERAVIALTE